MDSSSVTRLCEHCLLRRPLHEFRRRHAGGNQRLSQCRDCHNAAERVRRGLTRAKATRSQLAKSLTKLRHRRTDLQLKGLGREMVGVFGGVSGIVEEWRRCLHEDLARGGYAAFRHLQALLRLIEYHEQNKPDYGAMSDEQLEMVCAQLEKTLQIECVEEGPFDLD